MPLGGLAISVGLVFIGIGVFLVGYPEQLAGSWFGVADSAPEDRPAGVTTRRWAQFRGGLAAAIGLVMVVVGLSSML